MYKRQVSIRQNGYEIYQSTVPPGPFTIDDLYAAGNGGDLQVTIKEADGSRQVFSVPWSTVPVLQREGHTPVSYTHLVKFNNDLTQARKTKNMPAIKGKTMTNNADIKKRNFLTQNEIESLLKAADTGPYAARNYCLTLLCFIHGLRASEICRLRISDIDLAARCV